MRSQYDMIAGDCGHPVRDITIIGRMIEHYAEAAWGLALAESRQVDQLSASGRARTRRRAAEILRPSILTLVAELLGTCPDCVRRGSGPAR